MYRQSPVRKKGTQGEACATGRNPTDRGKAGSKRHLLTDGRGVPLAVVLSGANRHDMKKLAQLLDAVVVEKPDPKQLEQHLCLDRGYDYSSCRQEAETRGYIAHIPKKDAPIPAPTDGLRHPPRRWVVEVGHSWFNRFRRRAHPLGKTTRALLGIYSASGLPDLIP